MAFDHEAPAVAFPIPVLVVPVGVVVGGEAVVERDSAPGGEDLADRRAEVVRELDALAGVADHGLPLDRHGTGEIAVRGDRADRQPDFAREVAKALAVVGGEVHGRGVRPLRVEFEAFPPLLFREADEAEDVDGFAPIPHAAVGNAVKSDLHHEANHIMYGLWSAYEVRPH